MEAIVKRSVLLIASLAFVLTCLIGLLFRTPSVMLIVRASVAAAVFGCIGYVVTRHVVFAILIAEMARHAQEHADDLHPSEPREEE